MLWEELNTNNFEDAVKKSEGVCVIPIGVIEKHGDHLPLGTDMYIVNEAVKAAAEKTPAVVFPYYFFGQIAEAAHEKGCIAPSHRLIMDALLEMCDEISRNGFKKILILSGHGGNLHFLPFFAQQFPGINRPYAVYTSFAHYMTNQQVEAIMSKAGIKDLGGHAGFAETSLIMYLRPDLVKMENVKVSESEELGRLNNIKNKNLFTGFNWYSDFPHHFAGDPAGSSPEHGKFIFDIIVENTVNMINAIKTDDVSLKLINEYNSLANRKS